MKRSGLGVLLFLAFLLPQTSGCSHHGIITDLQTFRVGSGGNELGHEELNQWYIFFGLFRLNDVNAQRVVADYTSYDVTTGSTFMDWMVSIILFPLTVTRSTVRIDY